MCRSPKLIAACHVLLRLLMPRHSPCALISLTFVRENFAPLRSPEGEHPFRSASSSSQIQTRLRWALDLFWFSFKNYAGSQKIFSQNCIYPIKKFPQCCFKFRGFHRALCCLAFSLLPLFSFQGTNKDTRMYPQN